MISQGVTAANTALTLCSQKYNGLMAELRENGW